MLASSNPNADWRLKKKPQLIKVTHPSHTLQQTLVISTLFYREFTKICGYNL